MHDSRTPRLLAVLDDTTKRELESLVKDLPARLATLDSKRLDTPNSAAPHFREEMESLSSQALDLILAQPPKQLLAYIWSMHYLLILNENEEQGEEYRPCKARTNEMQFLLEYMHAAWSSNAPLTEETAKLDEAKIASLFKTLGALRDTTLCYCLMRAKSIASTKGDNLSGDMSFKAMMAWVHLRGRRYQMLEGQFLQFVLQPHDEALQNSYGIGAKEIAAGIQAISDTMRSGLNDSVELIHRHLYGVDPLDDSKGKRSVESVSDVRNAVDDLLCGGICNLSRHSALTQPLLEDLSFAPGENEEFLANGEFRGTPLRTMPALVRPGIKLGGEYYIADSQLVRDVAYRTIQRGMLRRNPQYHENWNQRQKHLIEGAIPTIFANQLAGAQILHSVYFEELGTKRWVETDLVVVIEDILLLVEAKAGVMAMQSPAVDFDRHMLRVERLIVDAYRQCKRFLDYIASANNVPIYELRAGRHVEVANLRFADFRKVLPIGVTVESMPPFTACAGNLDGIEPLLSRHAFISMSVDDLLVLNRFLPNTGELLHYLEVRQQAGNVPDVTLFDEIEYLGAYISCNRFDLVLKEQRAKAKSVLWNTFADTVDQYFEGDYAGTGAVPHQSYPPELAAVLELLDQKRPTEWLEMDSAIRSLSREARESLAKGIAELKASVWQRAHSCVLLCEEVPIQVWICGEGMEPTERMLRHRAEVACLFANAPRTLVIQLSCNKRTEMTSAACMSYRCPNPTRDDYVMLRREALKLRIHSLGNRGS